MSTLDPQPRVLVIEDNSELRELIGSALSDAGYEVALAGDGSKAVQAQRTQAADLAITDIFMPDQDGIETILLFKKEFPATPIIAMSGGTKYATRGSRVDYLSTARKFGADRLLHKPFGIDELLEVVKEMLGGPRLTPREA